MKYTFTRFSKKYGGSFYPLQKNGHWIGISPRPLALPKRRHATASISSEKGLKGDPVRGRKTRPVLKVRKSLPNSTPPTPSCLMIAPLQLLQHGQCIFSILRLGSECRWCWSLTIWHVLTLGFSRMVSPRTTTVSAPACCKFAPSSRFKKSKNRIASAFTRHVQQIAPSTMRTLSSYSGCGYLGWANFITTWPSNSPNEKIHMKHAPFSTSAHLMRAFAITYLCRFGPRHWEFPKLQSLTVGSHVNIWKKGWNINV